MSDAGMSSPGDVASSLRSQEEPVNRAKLDNLFKQVRISVCVNILLAIMITWSYSHTLPVFLLLAWFTSLSTINFYRWTLAGRYLSGSHETDPGSQTTGFLVWTLASGMLWGFSVPLFLPYTDRMDQQFLLIIAIAGLAAGAIPMLASVLRIYLGYLVALLAPTCAWFFLSNDHVHIAIGAMTLMLATVLAFAGRNYAANFHCSQSLASALSSAKAHTEKVNSDLHQKISEALKIQDALRESEQRFHMAFEQAPIGMALIDHDSRLAQANPTLAGLLGYSTSELIGKRISSLVLDEDLIGFEHTLNALREEKDSRAHTDLRLVRADGRIVWASVAMAFIDPSRTDEKHMILQLQDITESVELSARLQYEAAHDELTGFINRREFERRLTRLLANHENHGTGHILCYLDLDRFKVINDSEGHIAGDEVLRQVAAILQEHLRGGDTIARIGGDEFAILLEHCDIDSARRVADTLVMAVNEFRFFWSDKVFRLDLSIGIASIEPAYCNTYDMLRVADAACAAAKEAGGARSHVYRAHDEDIQRRQGEIQWLGLLTDALDSDGFDLYAQPIMPATPSPMASGLKFEILVRMQDTISDTLLPSAFLPAAERYGLAVRLDRWVMEAVFSWFRDNPEQIPGVDSCSINLSGVSLGDAEFTEYVMKLIRRAPLRPSQLQFEITETAAIGHLAQARNFMTRVQSLGCRFSLDDFGSGLSSFGYLRSLPVDTLKIDGQFVRDIVDDRVDRALVKSINEIGRVLNLTTVAECVENETTLEMLREIGVDYVQGYHTGKPGPLSEILDSAGTPARTNP